MSRTVWCLRCKAKLEHLGGALPDECPECEQSARWSTMEVPQKDWVLTANDIRFLRSLRIAANNDHEDDAA